MPCGKRPLVKSWDKPKHIRVIKPSRYQQNEASVKVHWKNVIKDIELSYKDEQFWENQCDTVRELVGSVIFERIAKIFNLPKDASQYQPQSEVSSMLPSEQFYTARSTVGDGLRPTFSMSDYEPSVDEEQVLEEQSEQWSVSSLPASEIKRLSRSKSLTNKPSKSVVLSSKSFSKSFILSKTFSKFMSKATVKSVASKMTSKSKVSDSSSYLPTESDDDIKVHAKSQKQRRHSYRRFQNPHFDMLFCNESETDMIKWKSKYKEKTFEVSASDEFSKKSELLTKKIAFEFFEWWVGLGNVEFKSEIKRPEDIEALFQVWFDEHASRGLKLDPKILPCVLQSIANYVGVPKASCPRVLKRQIASDIYAETSPAHIMAFGTYLPQKLKHIPPKNRTEEMWHCVKIPEDLRSMACVWEDIQHLTSTKAFQGWLSQRPHLPMPPCLNLQDSMDDKKQLFVVPSDFVVRDRSADISAQDLNIPISEFSFEIKEVLSRLLNE